MIHQLQSTAHIATTKFPLFQQTSPIIIRINGNLYHRHNLHKAFSTNVQHSPTSNKVQSHALKCIHHNIISLSEDHKETENAIIYGIYASKADDIAPLLEVPPEPPDLTQFISHIIIGRQTLLSSPKISRDNLKHAHTHTNSLIRLIHTRKYILIFTYSSEN